MSTQAGPCRSGPRVEVGTPVRRTVQECLQAGLWIAMSAPVPLAQVLSPGLLSVPVAHRPPDWVVVGRRDRPMPLVTAWAEHAVQAYATPAVGPGVSTPRR